MAGRIEKGVRQAVSVIFRLPFGDGFAGNSLVLGKNSFLDQLPHFAGNGIDNLEAISIGLGSIRHPNNITLRTLNNFNVPDHQRAIYDDNSVGLEIGFVDGNDFNVRDFHSLTAAKHDARLAITACTKWGQL